MPFPDQLNRLVQRVEAGLESLVPAATVRPVRLHAAMRYSLQAGGKRLRPVLLLATTDLFGAQADPLPAAVALECIHTYSLIHDDLPCMDNDDLRRGRPTAHKQFDEATALLAGDALLTLAFQLLARHYAGRPALAVALTREFAEAAGSEHLIGGQMEDLLAEGKSAATADELEFIHLNKTAAMLAAALVAGGFCGGADEAAQAALRRAGRHLGLAFQIVDDILDATADTATLGKTAGKDAKSGKTTYVRLHGLAASRRLAREHSAAAQAALAVLPGDHSFLTALIDSMATRAK
ncbi:MAG TPA: farnesyl diphosphate synthase [Lacunisphaera sp.]|jgi:geranylgeranyl pyrophosphate synthase|nr:farnesyl diphosphate synthase [Lacunisphaera sp.]